MKMPRSVAVMLLLMVTIPALAQDARNIIALAAEGIESGNLSVFGSQTARDIGDHLAQFQQLLSYVGPMIGVEMAEQFPMPRGVVIRGRAIHQNGYSDWTLAYSYDTRKIENGNFTAFPKRGTQPPTELTTQKLPTNQDQACKQYPGLC
jgi:hypothetical protein